MVLRRSQVAICWHHANLWHFQWIFCNSMLKMHSNENYTFCRVKMTLQLSDHLQQIHQKEKHTRKLLYMAKKTEKERKHNFIPENPYPQSSCNKFSVDRKHWSWRIRPVRTDNVAATIIMMRQIGKFQITDVTNTLRKKKHLYIHNFSIEKFRSHRCNLQVSQR